MKLRLSLFALQLLASLAGVAPSDSAAADPPARPASQTIRDEPYLQESGRQIATPTPLTGAAVLGQQVFVSSDKGLFKLEADRLTPIAGVDGPVDRLVAARGALWALTGSGLFRYQDSAVKKISGERITDVTEHLGHIVAAGERRLWRVDGDALLPLVDAESPFPITRVISHCESLYVHGPGRLTYCAGGRIGDENVYRWPADSTWDWGMLPSVTTRDALSQGSKLFLATDRGVAVLRGMLVTTIRGQQGLCYEDATCLAKGFDDDLWIGTSRGAIRMIDGEFQYFAGRRWLPDEQVHAIAASDHAVYLATSRGLGIIEYEPYTLQKKADYYEQQLDHWGQRRLGFTHKLEWDEPLQQYVREVSDNDGGYSGNYLAAQAYRYAVTKDPAARARAVETFQALRWLGTMTPIPGFIARAVWANGEIGHQAQHGSGGAPAEWHDAADGLFQWKGDTSSDEVCSHFYATRLFLEHVAQGEEVDQAKRHLAGMAAHIAEHGWKLVDLDGQPTRWGRWDPDYFATEEGLYDRGLQALQVLSFMKTAHILAADPRAGQAYQRLVDLGYPNFTLRQRNTFPPDGVLHFLDELALWSYANLLEYENDPQLRATYRRSLERSYELIRIEQNPWFNFVYGALTGNDCEAAQSVQHLRQWPLDLRVWSYQNSHRADLQTPAGYESHKAGIRPFSPRETEPMRWDHWTMQADGGSSLHPDVIEPGAWLLAYWMGRYHGYISPPTVADEALLRVQRPPQAPAGAKPYAGPPRPKLPD